MDNIYGGEGPKKARGRLGLQHPLAPRRRRHKWGGLNKFNILVGSIPLRAEHFGPPPCDLVILLYTIINCSTICFKLKPLQSVTPDHI